MMSHYTLYYVISHHDVTWIALECCSCDFCVAVGCIPTKQTFVWCTIWQYHFVWGGGRSSATPNSVILPDRSSDTGCFALMNPGEPSYSPWDSYTIL